MKELLFSVTKKDFEMQFFRAGGKGGQKQNKTSSACRIIHRDSGAVGESREERSQMQNRKIAFERCVKSPEFQSWLRLHTAVVLEGYRDIEAKVDEQMQEKYLKIETFTP